MESLSSLCFQADGQADVERGFNVKTELLVENMKNISLVKGLYLSVHKSELHNFQIDIRNCFYPFRGQPHKMVKGLSCKGARIKYDHYLEKKGIPRCIRESQEKKNNS